MRIFSRDEHGVLLQQCRACGFPHPMVDYHIKHKYGRNNKQVEEPYCRATTCNKCLQPNWRLKRVERLAALRKIGLNEHGKPLDTRTISERMGRIKILRTITTQLTFKGE